MACTYLAVQLSHNNNYTHALQTTIVSFVPLVCTSSCVHMKWQCIARAEKGGCTCTPSPSPTDLNFDHNERTGGYRVGRHTHRSLLILWSLCKTATSLILYGHLIVSSSGKTVHIAPLSIARKVCKVHVIQSFFVYRAHGIRLLLYNS